MTLHSGELRDLWQRLQLARETIEDIRYLIGPLDRDQAARFGEFLRQLEYESAELGKKIEAARIVEFARIDLTSMGARLDKRR